MVVEYSWRRLGVYYVFLSFYSDRWLLVSGVMVVRFFWGTG